MTLNPILAALIAVACWSTSATAVGFLGSLDTPFLLAALVQFTGAACLFVFRFSQIRALIALPFGKNGKNGQSLPARKVNPRPLHILIFIGCLIAYHALFYSAMMSGARLQANVANYLWPILLVLTNYFVFRNARIAPTAIDYCILGLGFLGCAALVGDMRGVLTDPDATTGFIFGLLAAVAASLYMGQSAAIVRNTHWTSIQLWFVGLLLSAPISYVIAIALGETDKPLRPDFLPIAIWLGIVTVAIAQVSWTWAISKANSVLPNILVYLTPIFSSLLQIAVFNDAVSSSFAFGLIFIVFASLITTRAFNSFFSELGAAIVFLYSAFFIFYRDWLAPELAQLGPGEVPIELFGIIAGFFLARQWQRSREEEVSLAAWAAKLHQICACFAADMNVGLKEPLRRYVRELIRAAVDLDQAPGKIEFVRQHSVFHSKFKGFDSFLVKYSQGFSAELQSQLAGLRRMLQDEGVRWIALKGDRTTSGDIIVVGLIGLALVVIHLKNAVTGAQVGLTELFIPPIIAYIGFRIAEYNIRPGMNSLSSIIQVQRACEAMRLPYYLGDYRQVQFDREVRLLESWIEFNDEEGFHEVHSSDPKSRLMGLLASRNLALVFLVTVPLIVGGLLWLGGGRAVTD